MNSKLFLVSILLVVLLLLTSCGECKINADCPEEKCFKAKCEGKKCVQETVSDCCGNGIEDKIEDGQPGTKCTCPEDYGFCEGAEGDYLQLDCDPKTHKCYASLIEATVDVVTLSDDLKHQAIEFKLLTTFNQPFDIDSDTFGMKLQLKTLPEDIRNVKLSKAELSATNKQRQTITLSEKEVDRMLWASGSEAADSLSLDFPTNVKEEELGSLRLRLTIEYEKQLRDQYETKSGVMDKRYTTTKFIYVDPDVPRSCPESCDDGNDATADSCSEMTDYFCEHTAIPGRCGNYICESSEDKCTCEVDCGPCQGQLGDYMEYVCSKSRCKSRLRNDVSLEPITKLDDRELPFGKVLAKYMYDKPFSMLSSEFEVEMELKQFKEGFSNFKIATVRVLERDEVIAELEDVDEVFTEEGDSETISLPASFYMQDGEQRERAATLKIWYVYDQEQPLGSNNTETLQRDYSQSLGKIDFINPELT